MSRIKEALLKFALDSDGELLKLPLLMLMQTIFFGGYKGSGKTTAMKKLFEAAHEAGAQCVAVAPLGKWWSLRIAKNGKGKGLKGVVVFGGEFGDVPILQGSGRVIARTVHEKKLHAVLDVELMRKDDRAVFLADFFEELMMLRKKGRHGAMVVFLDETQSVAPQLSTSREVQRLRAILGDFARECRNFSCGLVMSAQRAASVDKELIALSDMLIVMRTVHNLDRTTYKKWVDEKGSKGDDDEEAGTWLRKLRRLKKGEAYLYAPEQELFQRVSVMLPKTFDATATATIGARVAKVGRLNKLDVKKLSAELAAVVETAAANDPQILRAEIERLKKLMESARSVALRTLTREKPAPTPKVDKRALKRIEKVGKLAFNAAAAINRALVNFKEVSQEFSAAAVKLARPIVLAPGESTPGYTIKTSEKSATPVRVEIRQQEKVRLFGERYSVKPEDVLKDIKRRDSPLSAMAEDVAGGLDVVGKQKTILGVLMNYSMSRDVLAQAIGRNQNSTFRAYVARLKQRGIITEENDKLQLSGFMLAAWQGRTR